MVHNRRMKRRFVQVDVFGESPYLGNPVAVVLDANGIDDEAMATIARWTNLSETTFVLSPTTGAADYRVRIWTPFGELPFAGHPTLGTCWAWRSNGGVSTRPGVTIQECDAGLITVRDDIDRLAFAAPPLVRGGPVEPDLVADVIDAMQIDASDVEDSQWVDNGPGWMAVLLRSADAVRAAHPCRLPVKVGLVGLVGAEPPGAQTDVEVRAFFPKDGLPAEDPVTGSLNASLGQWLIESGRLRSPYVAEPGFCPRPRRTCARQPGRRRAGMGRRQHTHPDRRHDRFVDPADSVARSVTNRRERSFDTCVRRSHQAMARVGRYRRATAPDRNS